MLWKDKSTSWVKLKDLKASNPIELAEYAVVNRIAEEPAFKWWVSTAKCRETFPPQGNRTFASLTG
jgi:hypothetical protein